MATREQITLLMNQLCKAPPSACLPDFDRNTAGIRAILKILNETDGKITAGKLSEYMHVSTARIAVLLKKMEAKDLIVKQQDLADGRVVVVTLSGHGKQVADAFRENLYNHMGDLIDRIGMERMLEFAAISNEIRSVLPRPEPNIDL